jgi:hypothetical protein
VEYGLSSEGQTVCEILFPNKQSKMNWRCGSSGRTWSSSPSPTKKKIGRIPLANLNLISLPTLVPTRKNYIFTIKSQEKI